MIEVNIREAKTQLSRLIAKVEQGEEVVAESVKRNRKLGVCAGKIWIADDFDAPLDPETFDDER
jgi:hypothetical protein